jgi:hypothetical protein
MQRAVTSFRGEAPRVTPRALPDNAAVDATNARLLTGDLTAWKQFSFTAALANYPGPVETIYKLNGAWLSWTQDIDVARGIIPGDTTFRTYLTGLDVPRFTNYALATSGAQPYPTETRILGVPAPDAVPTVVLGVDPTSTSFSVDVTDSGDALATSWTTSPTTSGSNYTSSVTQDAVIGNPAPSYKLTFYNNNLDKPCYAYRNFGVGSATVVTMNADFYMTAAGGQYQARFRIANDSTGAGLSAQVQFPFGTGAGPYLVICTVNAWNEPGSIIAQAALSALTMASWYHMAMTLVRNSDNSVTLTATLTHGATELASVTHTSATSPMDNYCGMNCAAADLGGSQSTYFDNIHVQASGSTGYTPVNLATSYVYTFVNDIGEESAPSLPSATVVRPDGVSATVTTPTTLPTGISTDYGITTKRIYRAATGNTGTEFLFVAEIPLSQADYVDVLTDAELGEVLPSDIWTLPPDDLRGIMALPNGIMVGFRRNQLCFSAQNQPHAWPVEYRLNTDTDIVGIGNIDNTVVIGTQSFVYVATGNDPAAYSMSKFEVPYAAMSKLSFTYLTGIGVVFAGTNGLMACAGIGQVRNLTEGVFTDTQWKALEPSSMRCVAHNDICFLFWENDTAKGCYAIDMKATGFGIVPMSFHASAAYVDPVGDVMYLVLDYDSEPDDASLPIPPTTPPYIEGTHIYEFEGSDTDSMTYRWRSKLWLLERPTTMLIAQVRAEDYDNILFRVYADGVQVDEIVITEETEFTLTAVDEYTTLQFEVLGTSTVRVLETAEDVSELS